MKMVIYKYTFPNLHLFSGYLDAVLPKDATLLKARVNNTTTDIWVLTSPVDKYSVLVKRRLAIVGTGWEFHFTENSKYVETLLVDGFVWHLLDHGEVE